MSNLPASEPSAPLVVVEPDPAVRSRLAMQLGERAVALEVLDGVEERYAGSPLLLVLGPSCARIPGMAGAEALLGRRPDVGAILIADDLSTDLFQRAIRSGVRDVLGAPVDTGQLNEAVRRVSSSLVGVAPRPSSPATIHADDEPGAGGQVITVFSTKGGAGKSMLATNLGVLLAQRSEGPVCLVDADLQFGDIAVMLKLAPQHTIVDAVGSYDRLDVGFLESLLATHQPSGLKVLPAPLEPAFADQVGADQMSHIIALLRSFCSFVVVDTPAYFNDVVLSLIEDSDDVLLVAGMDIPNIKNVKIGLQTLRLLNTPMQKIHLILNRANSKVKLEVSEVERTLQVKADALIPSDIVVPQSVNKGTPVVLDAPRSAIAKSLEQLADRFIEAPAGKRRGRR
ncbi:P-loop NTPase [Aquihabitans sp. G128]|uniref:AAA family ATPase n=1 Tax=Aquihabitans sp. G128 TaxID=2849779 RepID=UPI001C22796E|nr:P-loop NTPase [Aquihabitans sp. G128]QXC61685.1 P-loop NTPase [Aquihabitans sp. G128]